MADYDLLHIFTAASLERLIYFLVLVLQILYVAFAFIMTRQIRLMNTSVTTSVAPMFTGVARIHLLFSIGIVILSILLI